MPSPDRLRAGSIGYLVGAWQVARGSVHSSYAGAVNVVLDGRWHCLIPARLPQGPTSIRVSDHQWGGLRRVRAGDPAALRGASLRIGPAVVDLRTATVWRPRPASDPREAGLLERAAALRGAALGRGAAPWIPAALEQALGGGIVDDAGRRSPGLSPGAAVAAMIGRGVGLTPAGDDALVGALAATAAMRAVDASAAAGHARLAAAVARHLPGTSDLSAAFLRLAAQGHFAEPVLDAVDAVVSGSGPVLGARLFDVGATSGADTALGLASAVHTIIRMQTSKVAA